MNGSGKKVVVAMSGGVDSSVAAALLAQRGYSVIGVFMRLGSPKGVQLAEDSHGKKQGCCSVLDAQDARRVSQALEIPFYVLNFEDEFGKVIEYFVGEYNRGRTPNPCVRCNDWLKFGKLTQYAEAVGAEFVASGHYARVGVDPVNGEKALLRAVDASKDQSDVLFGMTRAVLEHTLLPIGEFEKSDVRKMAQELNLPVYNKPDSQEICFVPDQDYAALVKRTTPGEVRPGEVVFSDGRAVGTHPGHQQFTIGQRKGVGVALGRPVYVIDIDPRANRVTLGEKEQLMKRSLAAGAVNRLSGRLRADGREFRCRAKIRHKHEAAAATARLQESGELHVHFDEAQMAITPGQAVVLYDGEVVLGGGWIDRGDRVIRRNVLIFHSGGLGDFVLSWPLGLALGRLYPQSRIIYVTQASKGELAAKALRLDWRDAESGWAGLYFDPSALHEKARQVVAEAHCVFSYVARKGDAFWKNVARIAPAAATVPLGGIPPVGYGGHVTEYLLEQLEPVPTVRAAVEQILVSIGKNGIASRAAVHPEWVAVHPGSGGRDKCWPVDKFVELAQRLVARGRAVKVVLGEVELERMAAGDIERLEAIARVVRPGKYVDLYAELSAAAGFIGNDSGPGHLAAMMGVATLSLFGGTDPAIWRPIGPRTAVMRRANLSTMEAADVDQGLEQLMQAGNSPRLP